MPDSETRFAVLLFTDIVGSTELKARHGVPAFSAALRTHNGHFERIASECRNIRVLQSMGDGYFAEAGGVAEAVKFALLFQQAMRDGPWGDFALATRVGIHVGEITSLGTDAGGGIVAPAADLASRVMSLAIGGQILLTQFPFDEARHFIREHPPVADRPMPPLRWLAHGPYLLKGRDEPMDIFEVGADGLAPLTAPQDSEKAKRAIRPGEEETLGWRPAAGLEIPGRVSWMLVRKIGEGGFGEVWLAEQAAMKQQRVFKFCFDEERLRSFKRELTFFRLIRDALGERPDIARLYDVKLDTPPFFLESEFAEHGNLVEWCERQGGIGAVPPERRLELMAQVAEAVAAAHSVGILHKDIKPQNILMQTRADGDDRPQLTDFGIGALSDRAALADRAITAAGFTVNTLMHKGSGSSMTRLYAPPEQLAGKPYTVQGDVYALGVILYQLVLGDFTRALAPGWERDVQDDLLREDLAECLDGEPARRLASATELAGRLRSLEDRRTARRAELHRQQSHARRKRTARLAVVGAAVAIGTAIVLGLGLFRERKLRQRASTAEQLAQARLSHAQEARDAAEKLVSEAVLGLHDKLVPIGRINILEDLATAAENYYAKLPADLVSDVTRRHEVWLALNRAIIADASSDDDAKEAACRKALALVRELSVKSPDDDTLRGDEFYALIALASLLYGEERHEELVAVGGQLATFAADWLRLHPQSPGALRTKLASLCVSLLAHRESDANPTAVFALFTEAQGVAEQLKKIGGETMETRVFAGLNTFANGLFMWKLHNTDAALKRFAEADAAFSDALGKANGHPFVHELMLLARRWSLLRLADFAQQRGDAELEKEVHRQVQKLIADLTALAEFEPARLERWRQLGWLYLNSGGLVRTLEGESARQAWLEKGIAAADRAVAPKFDRPGVRRLRALLLGDLSDSLATSRPAGWPLRVIALLSEMDGILLAPSKSGPVLLYDGYLWQSLNQWNRALAALGDDPAQREVFIAQAGAEAASAQRVIDAFPAIAKLRLDADEQVGKAAELLRRHGCPEAADLEKQCARWRTEVDEKFADDPVVIRTRAWQAKERGLAMLGVLRAAPAEEKAARFAELEKHLRAAIANLHARQAQLSEYDATMLHGECLAFLGEAQLEQGQFAVAEDTLRAAMAMRSAAAAKAPKPDEAVQRHWDVADSQGRLGLAIFKQGREEDGRKLRRACAETMADLAKQAPTIGRLRNVVWAWRTCAELFPRPEDRTERIALLQKSAEAAHAMLKFAKTATGMNENEPAWNLGEANWTLLALGWNLRDAKDLPASEAALREGVGYATENLAHASPADFPKRAEMRGHLRYDLALTLLAAGRTDEAREQVEQITKEIHRVEQATAPDNPHATRMRRWIEHLATLLPTQ